MATSASTESQPEIPGFIHRLPSEILEIIFLTLITLDVDKRRGPDRTQRTLRIGHICRWWRMVLYEYPALWSNIEVMSVKAHTITILRHFLKNSASHSLKITACLDISGPASSTTERDFILDELLAHISRWESVVLTVNWVVYWPLCQIVPGSLEQLASITFSAPGWNREHVQEFWNSVCHEKNRELCNATWQVDSLNHPPTFAPWHRLVNIKLGSFISLAEAITILISCSSLESLSLKELRKGSAEPLADLRQITLPKLQSLEIRPSNGIDISPLLDHISVPNLVKLDVSFTPPPYVVFRHFAFPFDSLFEMLVRSQCHLQSFQIGTLWVVLHESQVLRYLQGPFTQSVRELTFIFWVTDVIMEALALLTNLTKLVSRRACPTDGVLARALLRRLNVTDLSLFAGESACLHIEMPLDPAAHPNDYAFILEVQQRGLVVFDDTRPKPVDIRSLSKLVDTKRVRTL